MNSRIRILMAGAACIAGLTLSARADTTDASGPAAAPAQGSVWMGGHWDSVSGQWKWVAPHWEQPPSASATWVAGHWVPQAGKWAWVNGAWNVGDAAQAQSAPPQPPSAPGALQDSPANLEYGPTPNTAAPYVDGGYGPGGVTRVVDQGEVVTDYGPATYGPSYAYDPYVWGAYPYGWGWGGPFFAVGFGGRYGGYGHYGYGHYGYGRGGYGRPGYGHAGSGGNFSHGSSGGHFGGSHR